MNIKSIVMMAAVGIISLFFINMSLAANTAKVKVETANLRETAEENAKILEQLSINEEVEVIEKTGNWYQVKAKGMTGYIRQDLITVNGEVEPNATTSNQETVEKQEARGTNVPSEKKSSIFTVNVFSLFVGVWRDLYNQKAVGARLLYYSGVIRVLVPLTFC